MPDVPGSTADDPSPNKAWKLAAKEMHNIFRRLRDDFQLSIITLVGACSLIGISPYAFFRLVEGDLLVGVVDTLLVVATSVAVIYAWRTGNTVRPGQMLAVIYSAGAVLVASQLGTNGLFWFYTLILFNFFVVPPTQSIIATLLALAAICLFGFLNPGVVFETTYQMTSFVVTCLIASLFAFAFAFRARLQRRKLSELARVDPLTGAGNRRTMDDELDLALANHSRYGIECGIMVLDLDHFKSVNDRFGHRAGDRVLIDFVSIVSSTCRQSDKLFRLGGEEFVLLMPNIDHLGLEAAAASLVNTVADRLAGPGGTVTVSIGGCVLGSHITQESWLHEADECLYEAKRRGRNMCVVAPPGPRHQHLMPELSELTRDAVAVSN